jgi:hypothetical protein
MKFQTDRRTFLSRAGAATSLGTLALITGGAVRAQSVDSDTQEIENDETASESGVRDNDTGPNGDPAACCRRSGATDTDTGSSADPAGNGRGRNARRSGIADSDSGAMADPAGNGRGPTSHFRPDNSRSDTDTGANADPARVGAVKPDGY